MLGDKPLTIENVKAKIDSVQEEARKKLRHLRALLRCMEDEATGTKTAAEAEKASKAAAAAK